MNELINSNDLTMTSVDLHRVINQYREESELNPVRYGDFLARVEDEIDDLGVCESFVHPQNKQTLAMHRLNKDQCLLVGMRESKHVRKKVLTYINSLERKPVELPSTFAEALQLAANQALEIENQTRLLEQQAPAVKFVENYTQAGTGSKGFRQVAKLLKIKEPVFRAFLSDKKIMYRLAGEWTAHANHIDAGRFEVTTGESNSHVHNTTKFTGKGIEWIAGEWAKHQIKTGEEQ